MFVGQGAGAQAYQNAEHDTGAWARRRSMVVLKDQTRARSCKACGDLKLGTSTPLETQKAHTEVCRVVPFALRSMALGMR